jgi:hypothetical protein
MTSHRNSANRERTQESSASNSKSRSKKTGNDPNRAARTANTKKELQKLFMVIKSKDEEIELMK